MANTVIVDYNAGNLTSVAYALRHLGEEAIISREAADVRAASRVIFPGVGAAGAAMKSLKERGLDVALHDAVEKGVPVLGICVGCQIIFDRSEEDGGTEGLGLIPGNVRLFRFGAADARKVPHMGWNKVEFQSNHPVFSELERENYFYFVHSYYPAPRDPEVTQGASTYGKIRFAAAVARENLVAVQFHAEKSGPAGLNLLRSFLSWNP